MTVSQWLYDLDIFRGASVAHGRWRLSEPLLGSPDECIWFAEPGALVTIGWPTRLQQHLLEDRFALPFAGITPLLGCGLLDGDGHQVIVEARPRGELSSTAPDPGSAFRWGQQVATWAAAAHDAGVPLGGLRPEAVWIEHSLVTALTPRATHFWELADTDMGVVPGFATAVLSPERLAGDGPSLADDVFALAVTIVLWSTGRHPFDGQTRDAQLMAILAHQQPVLDIPQQAARSLNAALGEARARPSMRALAVALGEPS